MDEGMGEDFVFAPETSQWWNARNSDRANQKESVGPWNFRAEAPHLSNVLLPRKRVNHRSGREEQEGLEEGMGDKMEYGSRIGSNPATEKHIPELAHRRIGQNALDVCLYETDGGGK